MLTSDIMRRAPRSTYTELALAEAEQEQVIDAVRATGHLYLADRLNRCQQARLNRQPQTWPWRCHSAGCWACRRTQGRQWWRGVCGWISGADSSLVTMPTTGGVLASTQRLRKGLRDVRDRAARTDPLWRAVAMGGLSNSDRALLLVGHPGIDRFDLWTMLKGRWPEVAVTAVVSIEPSFLLTVEDATTLAVRRRGLEPGRVVVPAQRPLESDGDWDEPMPMLF